MQALVCVQATIPAFTDGKWHPSLLPMPRYMATYRPEHHMAMLHRLQTSSVAVVKDCFHTVWMDLEEDLFACPWFLVSEFFKRRAQVIASACVRAVGYSAPRCSSIFGFGA